MDFDSDESKTETEESEELEEQSSQQEEDEEEEVDPRTLLTKEQIQNFKALFDMFDVQKKEKVTSAKGEAPKTVKIPTKSIGYALRLMGLNPSKAQIKKHIREIDPENKGMIDFQSFLLPLAQRVNEEPETHEDIISAFECFDEEELDFITTDRLFEYLTTLGEDLEDFEIEPLLKMADPKGTGKVYYREFVEKVMGVVRKKETKKGKGKKEKKEKKKKKKTKTSA